MTVTGPEENLGEPINEWVVAELPEKTRNHTEFYQKTSQTLSEKAGITIREAQDYEDVGAIVSILNEVFGENGQTYYPPGLVRNLLVAGALLLLAEDPQTGQGTGTALSIPSWKKTEPMLQTGPMAVRKNWRKKGIGAALKQAQAAHALSAGVRYLSWSFDPISAYKAKINLQNLPTQISGYIPGVHIRPDLLIPDYPDDRLQVLWDLYQLHPKKLPPKTWLSLDGRPTKNLLNLLENPSCPPLKFTLDKNAENYKKTDPILALHHYRLMRSVFTTSVEKHWDAYYENHTYYIDTHN